jgi:hypothetical protein
MRIFYVFVFLLVLAVSCKQNPETNDYEIIVSNPQNPAAKQFQSYWGKISGAKIPIVSGQHQGKHHVFIGNDLLPDSLKNALDTVFDDGFLILKNQGNIHIAGKSTQADIFAVNTFFEQLGVMVFSKNEAYFPKRPVLDLQNEFKIYNPAFRWRHVYAPVMQDTVLRQWYKLDTQDDFGMFVHTFSKLIPPDKYFSSHPEYFSLVNGKRMPNAQLCLSNSEVIDLLTNNLGERIKKKPEKQIWSVSQNDTYNPCSCSSCRELYQKYGATSGAYIQMANHIADTYPDYTISTLAYQFTRQAPQNIKPRPNVNIMLCTIECSRSKPLVEFNQANSFKYNLEDWAALTHNLFLWDYEVQFRTYLCPFPNFPVLQPNIQLFKQYNADMMFQQCSGRSWSDLIELKQYLIAKLLWNPDINVDSLARRFIKHYYGPAAPYIEKYYRTMNKVMTEHRDTETLNIYGTPSDYTDSYLSPDLINYYVALMDSAETVTNDIYLDRVHRTRLAVDYAWVDIAVNNHYADLPAFVDSAGTQIINPKLLKKLQHLQDYAQKDASIKIGEHGESIDEYRANVLERLNRIRKANKLKGAKIDVSAASPKYPVDLPAAFVDGLTGGLGYRHNWVGYEGSDMILTADFGKTISFSSVQMTFLRATGSWIFLPEKVELEISDDGQHFQTLASLAGDTSIRDTKTELVNFDFKFAQTKSRFLRIHAKSIKTCPAWHKGFGQPSWIFCDEIIVQ